ncbi:Concanavalin A-like lectin/glucanase [Coniochaeta hoffmannii]|uniref:Concanavalin A-like lectin/glucanase n=1 Tax=Coniochaeta hoffmannii TaxID=91930 RepID=A0AA38SEW1_9PEZI|nr:Concanavalin A-like lectin/glucanase [Coniochaeta hoffmannii]
MKCIHAYSLLLALAAGFAFAEFTYTVTATKDGKPIQRSDILFEQVEPSLYRLNTTTTELAKPRDRGRRVKRVPNSIYYSSNWCGAVQNSAPTNKITSYVATWVGIDGATSGSALLQSGITSKITSTGVQTNWAWLEWIPDAAYNIPSFPVATGDWIEVTVSASSSTAGSITINNLDQSLNYYIPLNNGSPLARVDADWIIEDPATSGGLVPLARFTDTWFEDCTVTTANGSIKNIDAATMYFLSGSKCTSTQYDSTNFWASSS